QEGMPVRAQPHIALEHAITPRMAEREGGKRVLRCQPTRAAVGNPARIRPGERHAHSLASVLGLRGRRARGGALRAAAGSSLRISSALAPATSVSAPAALTLSDAGAAASAVRAAPLGAARPTF